VLRCDGWICFERGYSAWSVESDDVCKVYLFTEVGYISSGKGGETVSLRTVTFGGLVVLPGDEETVLVGLICGSFDFELVGLIPRWSLSAVAAVNIFTFPTVGVILFSDDGVDGETFFPNVNDLGVPCRELFGGEGVLAGLRAVLSIFLAFIVFSSRRLFLADKED
jgi:hypothetical protein